MKTDLREVRAGLLMKTRPSLSSEPDTLVIGPSFSCLFATTAMPYNQAFALLLQKHAERAQTRSSQRKD
jgi:hypothetical protein